MIRLDDIDQGTPEWFAARVGIPSASNFDKIFTSKGAKSAQSKAFMNTLLAEFITGEKASVKQTEWMERGIELEADARTAYEFITDESVEETGIVYADELRLVSCSPDGLMQTKGLEIKCPSPGVHIGYLIDQKLPTTYVQQVQGSMYVTGLLQWDFMSYHPDMKPVIITVDRDEKLITAIDEIMQDFIEAMLEKREQLEYLCAA
jgi:putative phage-type endonuclease